MDLILWIILWKIDYGFRVMFFWIPIIATKSLVSLCSDLLVSYICVCFAESKLSTAISNYVSFHKILYFYIIKCLFSFWK